MKIGIFGEQIHLQPLIQNLEDAGHTIEVLTFADIVENRMTCDGVILAQNAQLSQFLHDKPDFRGAILGMLHVALAAIPHVRLSLSFGVIEASAIPLSQAREFEGYRQHCDNPDNALNFVSAQTYALTLVDFRWESDALMQLVLKILDESIRTPQEFWTRMKLRKQAEY